MHYQRFDPTACGFPQPKVPILPVLSRQALRRGAASPFKPLGLGGNAQSFTRGRYALTQAYRLSGVGPNAAILIAAYHCRTMLDPAIRLGAPIVLYAVLPDLSPDLADLARCLAQSQHPVKALLLTHYFGFTQTLRPIVDFCAQHHITLIEDCSHALFVRTHSAASPANLVMGQTGRYGIASPYKFFPCEDGGLLWANAPDAPALAPQTPQPLKQQLRGILHALQHARATTVMASAARQSMPQPAPPPTGQDTLEQSPATSSYYQRAEEHQQSLACSRWVMRHTNVQHLAERRRQHYQQWVRAVAGLPHCRALFAELPADCVPYMFPLLIDHPAPHFFALKHLGVPIWRWDDMAVSGCAVAADYRLRLLHLPCHQELTPEQMAWMTRTVARVMHNPLTLQQTHPQNLNIRSAPNARH
jgi:dTDP-4-amino-4,6-dideoxygalactose transaminase